MNTITRRSLLGLILTVGASGVVAAAPQDDITAFLKGYDAAFAAKDLERLAAFYHPDVTIFEGGSTNDGWTDYRDHHLGPELQEFEAIGWSCRTSWASGSHPNRGRLHRGLPPRLDRPIIPSASRPR